MVASLFTGFSLFVRGVIKYDDCKDLFYNAPYMAEVIYWTLLAFFLLFSLAKPIEKSRVSYTVISILFSCLMFFAFLSSIIYFLTEGVKSYWGWLFMLILISYYSFPPLLRAKNLGCNFLRYVCGTLILTMMTPVYVNIVLPYSMANLHDVSWGNRDSGTTSSGDV